MPNRANFWSDVPDHFSRSAKTTTTNHAEEDGGTVTQLTSLVQMHSVFRGVLISNYAIPADFKPHIMQMPPELLKAASPLPDFSKFKLMPPRTDIVYRQNGGYNLTISNLPWGQKAFSVKRYRITKTQNLDFVDERSSDGPSLKLSDALAPNAVELIVLRRR